MRLIQRDNLGDRAYSVHWNSEFEEYVVKLYVLGKHYEPADYFTDCREDAIGTGCKMLESGIYA